MLNNENKSITKTAFIAIVGKPNVGKSSLLNTILGKKLSIVSSKPQTTRNRIIGILTKNNVQLVFIDTPGMHIPKTNLGKYMIKSINESISSVDACLMVVEAGAKLKNEELKFIEKFKQSNIKTILAINKIDLLKDKTILMEQIKSFSFLYNFDAIVPISAITRDGIESLILELNELAVESELFFGEDEITDQPERVIVSEIIREKALRFIDKEIPHGIAVFVEGMKEGILRDSSPFLDINATIYCERESHKGIIIGKHGNMLKKIGTCARQDMESFFECKVNLNLWVKVKEDWRNRESILRSLGYDKNDF